MEGNVGVHETAFDLKRKGSFKEALEMYAQEYASAVRRESKFVTEICFEQMFDIMLLKYLRERERARFLDSKDLLKKLEEELKSYIHEVEAYQPKEFQELMVRCRRKLFPRGRGKSAFSVDPSWLLETKDWEK